MQNMYTYDLSQGQNVLKGKETTTDPHHRDKVPFKIDLDYWEDASSSRWKKIKIVSVADEKQLKACYID